MINLAQAESDNPLALFCFTEYSYYMVGYYQN